MSRPLYETQLDKTREAAAIQLAASRWRASPVKLPMQYRIDYALMRDDRIAALAEVKCRDVDASQYPSLMLSLAKWQAGIALAGLLRVPFIIVASYADGARFVKVNELDAAAVTFGFGGRNDRNDEQDMEPVVYIPASCFVAIRTKEPATC